MVFLCSIAIIANFYCNICISIAVAIIYDILKLDYCIKNYIIQYIREVVYMKRNFHKLLSLVLTIMIIFSCCAIAFTAFAEQEGPVYYVSPNGTEDIINDGLSVATPLRTVDLAIQRAVADGYSTGDTVFVKLKNDGTNIWQGSLTQQHQALTAHDFVLNLSSYTDKAKIDVTFGGDPTVNINGPIVFENIDIAAGCSGYPYMNFANPNVTFGENVTVNKYFQISLYNSTHHINKNVVTNFKDCDISLREDRTYYVTMGGINKNYTINADWTVNVDIAGYQRFELADHGSAGVATYNGNLNFNIVNAQKIQFLGNAARQAFTANAAVQLINSAGIDTSNIKTYFEGLVNTENASVPYYLIHNNTDGKAVLSFTDTAGKYKVEIDTALYALKVDGVDAVIDGGYITLSSGEHTVTTEKAPVTVTYYVSPNGDDSNDGSENNPLKTVDGAIVKANSEGYVAGDTVNVKLIKTLDGDTEINNIWKLSDATSILTEHAFKLNISSHGDIATIGHVQDVFLGGDTDFYDVKITGGSYKRFSANNHNVSFSAETVFLVADIQFIAGGINTVSKDLYYNFYSATKPFFTLGGSGQKLVYDYNITVNVDNNGANEFRLGDRNSSSNNATYNKNVNFNIKNAASFKLGDHWNPIFGANAAVQIINSTKDSTMTATAKTWLNNNSVKYYIIHNNSDNKDLLSFTETSGVFAVNGLEENEKVEIYNADNQKISESGNGNITLESAGEYTVKTVYTYNGFESEYAGYIDYRDALNGNKALQNFSAKINNGEDVNVVYFGGSITVGQGSTNSDKLSWRAIVGEWLTDNAPNSTVTNINSAIGGTGTWFGFHRLQNAVLDHNPDLLFIEFSVNDFYEGLRYHEALQNFESIIRWVRSNAPECDIVTVLTTEKTCAQDLVNSGTIHTEARAHRDISIVYGIPTVRVGEALTDELQRVANEDGDDTTTWESYWSEYVSDIVHPKDKGYAIYANVLKEFLINSILGEGADAITVTPHIMPENTVNSELLVGDLPTGNITFIPADETLSEQSSSLGGDTFTTYPNTGNIKYFDSYYHMDDTNKVIKFKFTGNELSVIEETSKTDYTGVYISIDGGEEKFVSHDGKRVTVLASGLSNDEHTATVRIGGGSSGFEWFYGFYVRNTDVTVKKQQSNTNKTSPYYVSPDGSDSADGLTADTPLKTVDAAITKAKADGFGADDTVYIKVINVDGKTNAWKNNDSTKVALSEHLFTLNISSDADKATIANSTGVDFKGPIVFENINITNTGSGEVRLNFNGNNSKFGENVTVSGYNILMADHTAGDIYNNINLEFIGGTTNKLVTLGGYYKNFTMHGDINVVVDNNIATSFEIGDRGRGAPTYNRNINFNIKNSSGITLTCGPTYQKFGTNAAIQIINSAEIDTADMKTYLAARVTTEGAAVPYYIINNQTGAKEAISFTETAGKYKVNLDTERFTLKVDGADAVIESGFITLSSGEHTLTVSKEAETVTYFVGPNGSDSNSGKTEDNAFLTINAAIKAAKNNGLVAGDTVNLKVINNPGGFIAWGENTGVLETHKFKLNISSLTDRAIVGQDGYGVTFGGPISFENIRINPNGDGSYMNFNLNGNDVTFGKNVTFIGYQWNIYLAYNSGNYGEINLNLDSAVLQQEEGTSKWIFLGGYSYWPTFEKDINVTVNNLRENKLQIGGQNSGANFYGNINFNINKALGFTLDVNTKNNYYPGAAVQILNSAGISISDADIAEISGLKDTSGETVPYYVINNQTGDKNFVELTQTAGQYKLNLGLGKMIAVTNNQSGLTQHIVYNGLLNLPSGNWTVDYVAMDTPYTDGFDTESGYWNMGENTNISNGIVNLNSTLISNFALKDDQYISIDVKGSDLKNGFEIRARLNDSGTRYYAFNVSNNSIKLIKTGASSSLLEDEFTFDTNKTYRVSFSVISVGGNAKLTGYIHDYSENETKTITATDFDALDGIYFGFAAENNGVTVDNVYISTAGFEKNDKGWIENDVNGDRVFDIRDLVYAEENKLTTDYGIIARVDKYSNNVIDDNDIKNIVKLLLGHYPTDDTEALDYEFKYLQNTYNKLTTGNKTLNVAFLGGSVTDGVGADNKETDGWPRLICNNLAEDFGATVNENRQSIGGTGSYFAAFRYGHDIGTLPEEQPDLLFIEFAINDCYNFYSYDEVVKFSESLVRKAYSLNPNMDIVYVLTFDFDHDRRFEDYETLRAHKAVAEKYGLLCINLREKLAPTIDYAENFADGVHPSTEGYKKYAAEIYQQLSNCMPSLSEGIANSVITEKELPTPMTDYFRNLNLVESGDIDLSQSTGWSYVNGGFSTVGGKYGGKITSNTVGAKLVIEFTGDEFSFEYDHGTNGFVSVKVDGIPVKVKSDNDANALEILNADLSYSNPKTARVPISSYGTHTVEITLEDGTFDIAAFMYN